jgi:hypothetical protein
MDEIPCEFLPIPLALHDVKWEREGEGQGTGFVLVGGNDGGGGTIAIQGLHTAFEFRVPDMVYVPFPDPSLQRITINTHSRIINAKPLDRVSYLIMTTEEQLVEFSNGTFLRLLYIPYSMKPVQFYNFSRYMWSFSSARSL